MLFYIGQFLISALCHGLGYVSLGISYFYKWPSFQNTGRKVHHLAGVYGRMTAFAPHTTGIPLGTKKEL